MTTASRSPRLAALLAAMTLLFWIADEIVIAAAGGPGRSALDGPLFFVGAVMCVLSAAALGLALTPGRSRSRRLGAAILVLVAAIAASLGVNALIAVLGPADPSWIWGEINLFVAPPVVLALALHIVRRENIEAAGQPEVPSRRAGANHN